MRALIHTNWGIPHNFIGGTERFVINLAKGLRRRNVEAFVVCSNLEKEIEIEGVPVFGTVPKEHVAGVEKFGYANELFFKESIVGDRLTVESLERFARYVNDQLTPYSADVVHLNSFIAPAGGLRLDKPTAATSHEIPEEVDHYWGKGSFKQILDSVARPRSGLLNVQGLYAPSPYYSRVFSEKFGRIVEPIELGIDTSSFQDRPTNPELRRKFATDSELIVLLPSRFEPAQKGHDIALEAMARLKSKGFLVKMIFSGYDEAAYSGHGLALIETLKQLRIEDRVTLTRFDRMMDAYSIADIVISPERFCSYGLAICESLALGIPTVASPIPTYLEIGHGCDHAFFAKSNTAFGFEEAIAGAISARRHQTDYSDSAKRFRDAHSFDMCVEKYHGAYIKAIELARGKYESR